MDADFLRSLSPLGVGGVLAGVMFFVYRKDVREMLAAWKGQTELLVTVVKDNTAAITALRAEIKAQAAARKPR